MNYNRQHTSVSFLDFLHPVSDRLHYPCAFVTQDHRKRDQPAKFAFDCSDVGVAHRRRDHSDEDLLSSGRRETQLSELKRAVELFK